MTPALGKYCPIANLVCLTISPNCVAESLNNQLKMFIDQSTYQSSAHNDLFDYYPNLQGKIPYISLAVLPTRIHKLEKITNKLGINVYIKRDDLISGLDADNKPIYGGNKVRKLEFLLAEAQQLGAEKIMTFGCVGSNHAVATAVHAARLGMQTVCMLKDQPASMVVQRNLLLHLNYGTELYFNINDDERAINAINIWHNYYYREGKPPYVIPTGGSNILGTLGFVNAMCELAKQIKQGDMPTPSHIFVPCGSGATVAGMLLGCKLMGLKTRIVAVAIEPQNENFIVNTINNLFIQTNRFLSNLDNSIPLLSYNDKDLTLSYDFAGPSYGIFTQEGKEAFRLLKEIEDISLDGTYSAKSFAALLEQSQSLPKDAAVLFWNTYCGLDQSSVIRNKNYQELPDCFHDYFITKGLQ